MPRRKKEIVATIRQAKQNGSTTLDLTNCPLPDFIDTVCELTQLEELNLSHCHLATLPGAIGNLLNLKKLILQENQISTLPESICNLSKLEYLDLTLSGIEEVSEAVQKWLSQIATCLISGTALEKKANSTPFVMPENPNTLLEIFQLALDGYGQANDMEDRGANGWAVREESDKTIANIFNHIYELKTVLADFYQDFQQKSFYGFSQQSEKLLKHNPFKLPTVKDRQWLANNRNNPTAVIGSLSPKTEAFSQHLNFISEKYHSVIAILNYGNMLISNQPYAADESYFADYAASLYCAGEQRFYLELTEFGFGESVSWYVSEDAGQSWSKMPYFVQDFLEREKVNWQLLDSLAKD